MVYPLRASCCVPGKADSVGPPRHVGSHVLCLGGTLSSPLDSVMLELDYNKFS